jgi:hypothetical protein
MDVASTGEETIRTTRGRICEESGARAQLAAQPAASVRRYHGMVIAANREALIAETLTARAQNERELLSGVSAAIEILVSRSGAAFVAQQGQGGMPRL